MTAIIPASPTRTDRQSAEAHAHPHDLSPSEALPGSTPGEPDEMVGTTGFEPATSSPPVRRATMLRYVPTSVWMMG